MFPVLLRDVQAQASDAAAGQSLDVSALSS
jgi:hypothetical protein